MNKEKWLIYGILLLGIIFLINDVFAQAYAGAYYGTGFGLGGFNIRQGSYDLINFFVNWAEPFLQVTLGGYNYTGYLLFEKFLLFILLMSIVYVAIRKIPAFENQKFVIWTIAIIVPLLSVRFLNFEWLNTVFLNYQVLGVALAGILPFVIFLFFVHNALAQYPVARKIAWVFFIVVYYGLWTTSAEANYGVVYFWTMIISFVFLLLDGTIHRYLDKQKWADSDKEAVVAALARIGEELERLERPMAGIPEEARKAQQKKLLKRRQDLIKRIT
jgi:hypothetical protein